MRSRWMSHRQVACGSGALIALLSSSVLAFAEPLYAPDTSALDSTTIPEMSAEEQAALRDALNFDPARTMPATPLRLRMPNSSAQDFDWSHTNKVDGTAALTVKKPLTSEWDAKVGADFGLASASSTSYEPDRSPLFYKGRDTGSAWANVAVLPGLASFDARVDPSKDQSKLGTTLSHSLPFGTNYSLTLQGTYALTETLGNTPTTSAIPSAVAPGGPSQVWSTERMAKFNILSTGTTLGAGTFSSTTDYITHNKIMAEQKLFSNFNVTTAVTDVGTQTSSKSITAGFKYKW